MIFWELLEWGILMFTGSMTHIRYLRALLLLALSILSVVGLGSTAHSGAATAVADPNVKPMALRGEMGAVSTPPVRGLRWHLVDSVDPGDRGYSLRATAATGPNDVWAAGYWIDSSTDLHTYTERWDGSTWSRVPSPDNPQGRENRVLDMDAISSNDVWAVGGTEQ